MVASLRATWAGRDQGAPLRATQTPYRKAFPFGSAPPKALSRGPLKGPPLRERRDGSLPHGRAATRAAVSEAFKMAEETDFVIVDAHAPNPRVWID